IGAGKTTFARKLEKETKAIRITKDEWIIKIFGNKITSDKNFEVYDHNIIELARNISFQILKSGGDVIIDEGFWAKSQRDEMKKKILDIGAKPIFYYVESSVTKMKERVISRSKYPPIDSFEINEETFDKYLIYWEPPTVEEDILLVT
ncbi:MAG: ATP-binding protein, partial [bacterium]|nr:ATP-binding protein [bacterium]